eukprot:COSAG05_NODE_9180_length_642_cov_0.920810_1_plen_101_part_10
MRVSQQFASSQAYYCRESSQGQQDSCGSRRCPRVIRLEGAANRCVEGGTASAAPPVRMSIYDPTVYGLPDGGEEPVGSTQQRRRSAHSDRLPTSAAISSGS